MSAKYENVEYHLVDPSTNEVVGKMVKFMLIYPPNSTNEQINIFREIFNLNIQRFIDGKSEHLRLVGGNKDNSEDLIVLIFESKSSFIGNMF